MISIERDGHGYLCVWIDVKTGDAKYGSLFGWWRIRIYEHGAPHYFAAREALPLKKLIPWKMLDCGPHYAP